MKFSQSLSLDYLICDITVFCCEPHTICLSLQGDVPWWKSNFFISQPVLFSTWDGVFTSCLINIFGVIVFLRSGWLVGQAGLVNAVFIVIFTGNLF